MDEKARLDVYEDNPDYALATWYKASCSSDNQVDVTNLPSIEDIRKSFNTWAEDNIALVKSKICPIYSKLRSQFQSEVDLVMGLIEIVSEIFQLQDALPLSFLLVKYVLSEMCPSQ
jgi:hypothetical protein